MTQVYTTYSKNKRIHYMQFDSLTLIMASTLIAGKIVINEWIVPGTLSLA
jgi:hypothetical protein